MAETAGDEAVDRWPDLLPWQTAVAGEALAARSTWPHALLLDGPRGLGKRILAINLARALLCESPADGRILLRRMCQLPLRRRRPASRPADDRAVRRRRRRRGEGAGSDTRGPHPRAHRVGAADQSPRARQGGDHRARGKHEPRRRERAAEDARGAASGDVPHPRVASARARAGDAAQPLPAHGGAATRDEGRRTLAGATGCDESAVRVGASRWRAAAGASPWPAPSGSRNARCGCRRWRSRTRCRRSRSPRESKRRRRTSAANALGKCIDWMLAWTADLSRVAAGGAAARNTDFAAAFRPLAAAVAPIPLFRYHRTLLRQRALVAHPLQPRLVAEAVLIGYRELFR